MVFCQKVPLGQWLVGKVNKRVRGSDERTNVYRVRDSGTYKEKNLAARGPAYFANIDADAQLTTREEG
jgi:hypothetical protein